MFLEVACQPRYWNPCGSSMITIVFWGQDRREDLSVADHHRVKSKAALRRSMGVRDNTSCMEESASRRPLFLIYDFLLEHYRSVLVRVVRIA